MAEASANEAAAVKNMVAGIDAALVRRNETLTGARKAAILLMALGDEVASNVFKHLEEDEVQEITKELALVQRITSDVADDVVEEFYQLMVARSFVVSGGVDYAKRLLVKTFGPEV